MANHRINISVGDVFNRLTTLEIFSTAREIRWLCLCVCGGLCITTSSRLASNRAKSCGCLLSDTLKKRNTKHGECGSLTYKAWAGMLTRCRNENQAGYKDYGGRGITVCKRWLKFENFKSDMGECPTGHQLDREDNSKGYTPSNCRWVTAKINCRNIRSNVLVSYKGKEMTLVEASERSGISYAALQKRIKKGDNKPFRTYIKGSRNVNT